MFAFSFVVAYGIVAAAAVGTAIVVLTAGFAAYCTYKLSKKVDIKVTLK